MITFLLHLLRLLSFLFGGHRQLALENLALRHQLAVGDGGTGPRDGAVDIEGQTRDVEPGQGVEHERLVELHQGPQRLLREPGWPSCRSITVNTITSRDKLDLVIPQASRYRQGYGPAPYKQRADWPKAYLTGSLFRQILQRIERLATYTDPAILYKHPAGASTPIARAGGFWLSLLIHHFHKRRQHRPHQTREEGHHQLR
jgi:hypothetical protein